MTRPCVRNATLKPLTGRDVKSKYPVTPQATALNDRVCVADLLSLKTRREPGSLPISLAVLEGYGSQEAPLPLADLKCYR